MSYKTVSHRIPNMETKYEQGRSKISDNIRGKQRLQIRVTHCGQNEVYKYMGRIIYITMSNIKERDKSKSHLKCYNMDEKE